MLNDPHAAYLRMKKTDTLNARLCCTWYEYGYLAARDVDLNSGDNSTGPLRTLHVLREQLAEIHADRKLASELDAISAAISRATDDATGWLLDEEDAA